MRILQIKTKHMYRGFLWNPGGFQFLSPRSQTSSALYHVGGLGTPKWVPMMGKQLWMSVSHPYENGW